MYDRVMCLQWLSLNQNYGKSIYLHTMVYFVCQKSHGEDKTVDSKYLSIF